MNKKSERPVITIHRGTRQIGGCVTEIAYGGAKVFIDIGDNLPGLYAPLTGIDGLTCGSPEGSALFLTHYHGDHIGELDSVIENVPVYMGETAKRMYTNWVAAINDIEARFTALCAKEWDKYGADILKGRAMSQFRIVTFNVLDQNKVGEITVMPLRIDHSAFDSYMFVVEAGGCRILHTGDFRMHGFLGKNMDHVLNLYAKDIDYIICEGTMLSCKGELPMSEAKLMREADLLMGKSKHVFVLCSSMNIDRISAFYYANQNYKGRLFICDKYQKSQLEIVRAAAGGKGPLYNFKYIYSYDKNLDKHMDEKGFCMLVRASPFFIPFLEKYKSDSMLIYSMWTGYLDERARNEKLCEFLAPYKYEVLHTSGHASPGEIRRMYDIVKPKKGLIPIHTEVPEAFKNLIPEGNIIILEDEERFIATGSKWTGGENNGQQHVNRDNTSDFI